MNRKFIILLTVLIALSLTFTLHLKRPTSYDTTGELNTPIGVGIANPENIDFLNSRLKSHDIIAVRPHLIAYLNMVETGRKTLVFGNFYYENASQIIKDAKSLGAVIIGFNLEGPFTKEEMLNKEKAVYQIVKAYNLTYMFGPTVNQLQKNYKDYVKYTDIIIIQSQRFQLEENYRAIIEEIASNIRKANPNVEVWVQVSVNPPMNRYITAEEVVRNILDIADFVDGVWIFYTAQRWNVAKEVISVLRPQPTSYLLDKIYQFGVPCFEALSFSENFRSISLLLSEAVAGDTSYIPWIKYVASF